jgi:hypothetical protein
MMFWMINARLCHPWRRYCGGYVSERLLQVEG